MVPTGSACCLTPESAGGGGTAAVYRVNGVSGALLTRNSLPQDITLDSSHTDTLGSESQATMTAIPDPPSSQQYSAPATSTSANTGKKQGAPPTVDTLTSTLQSCKLAEKNSAAYSHIDPARLKKLFLDGDAVEDQPREGADAASSSSLSPALPSLSVLLHDRIWAQGGELVMLLGVPVLQDDGEGRQRKSLEGVEHVNVDFTPEETAQAIDNIRHACSQVACQSVVLHQSNGGQGSYAYLMLRRIPSGAQELLELRVAVIGNGEWRARTFIHLLIPRPLSPIPTSPSRCGEIFDARRAHKGRARRRAGESAGESVST